MVLAAETSMTDLIIGGHTHSYLDKPIVEKNKAGNPVIINQAWWGGLVLGKIDFVFERSNRITSYNVCYTKLLRVGTVGTVARIRVTLFLSHNSITFFA